MCVTWWVPKHCIIFLLEDKYLGSTCLVQLEIFSEVTSGGKDKRQKEKMGLLTER